MIGQSKLKQLVGSFSKETFPQVVLLCGDYGCGKHTFINECMLPIISPDSVEDITSVLSFDLFMQAEVDSRNILYLVDIRNISEEKQNILLKFLEEPPERCHVVLLSRYQSDVIPTILNRCYTFIFEQYTFEELSAYCSENGIDPAFIKVTRTIGGLNAYKNFHVSEVTNICRTLLTSARSAQLSNLFSLSDRIDWGNSGSGYNSDFFFKVLLLECFNMYRDKEIQIGAFLLTEKTLCNITNVSNVDKKRLFDKYLIDLKYERL